VPQRLDVEDLFELVVASETGSGGWMRTIGMETFGLPDLCASSPDAGAVSAVFRAQGPYLIQRNRRLDPGQTVSAGGRLWRVVPPDRAPFVGGPFGLQCFATL
jgi:hypothetical protein